MSKQIFSLLFSSWPMDIKYAVLRSLLLVTWMVLVIKTCERERKMGNEKERKWKLLIYSYIWSL